jgi:hypothetical protein
MDKNSDIDILEVILEKNEFTTQHYNILKPLIDKDNFKDK